MVVVGLDIGGSKTHAVRAGDGVTHAEAYAGSANLASVGTAEAERQLDLVLARLGRTARPVDVVCAGAAGADTPATTAQLHVLLAGRFPGAEVRVVHDTELLLAASGDAGLATGVAVIAGTGSVAWGRDATGATARAGGWGHQLGDEGSGYWVAGQAVRHALRRADLGLPIDDLTGALLAGCGLQRPEQLLDCFYAQGERRFWAGQAALVFALAASDPAARRIVDRAADALAALVTTVLARLDGSRPLPVVLGGGVLVHQPLLQAAVADRLRASSTTHGGATDVRPLTLDPVHGAVRLALAVRPAVRRTTRSTTCSTALNPV
jgi:N-acetylglucosamine kinase-like BadF-type ATPase